MTPKSPPTIRYGQLAAGLVLTGLGVLFWLDQIGRVDAGHLDDYWPMVLVVIGLGRLLEGGRKARAGAVLLTLGILFQLDRLHLLRFRETWPLVLVVLGVTLAWGAFAAVAVSAFTDDDEEPRLGPAPPPPPPPGFDEEDSRG